MTAKVNHLKSVSMIITPTVKVIITLDQSTMPPRIATAVEPEAALSNATVVSLLLQATNMYAQRMVQYERQSQEQIAGLQKLVSDDKLQS